MQKNREKSRRRPMAGRRALFGTATLVGLVAQALAQQAAPAPEAKETVSITGYRASVESSTRDKREATGFQDSVFAEDMGKFPDSNIAESLNRIPGVLISREITGEGINIQIRGLGTSFTKILLNGAPVAVASTGRTDNQNTNREVDLDLLPTELFTRLSVYKSPTAAMTEGGAAGVVDMRTARPFDNPGRNVVLSLAGVQNTVADKTGNRGSILVSDTWGGGTLGLLGGVAWANNKVQTTGFETIGWTNPNLSATQNTSATRNNTGGGNYTIPGTVPANAGNGLVTGTVIDQNFLLAHNPGLNITQIDNAIIPRLGRNMDEYGTKDRVSGVVSFEYRPSDDLHFYVDGLAAKKKNDMKRIDMNWVGRNGAVIPLGMTVDRDDCTNGCVVTHATFANAQYFLEFRPYIEDVNLYGVNPGMEWKLGKNLMLDAQINWTKSSFHRESPTVLPITAGSSGITVNYDNGGGIPSIVSNIDLNNPANFQWNGGRVNQQEEFRDTETKGARFNFTWGDKKFNVKAGGAYDDIERRIRAKDNSGAWQAATCGNNPSVFLLGPNGAPPCDGANTPGASAAALYPGYGTGYTAGQTGPITYQGSLIPGTALQSYLTPGPAGFVTVDWDRFSRDSHYQQFVGSAPEVGSSNTGASAGFVREKASAAYAEVNGNNEIGSMPIRYNAGIRFVRTEQEVGGFVSIPDPRNAALNLANGGKYPNIDNVVYLNTTYNNTLPSATAALNVTKEFVVRASASRSLTRADPNALRPGINFSSPSADVATVGNETLKPYLSDNLDLGFEYYTGGSGYVSATPFYKRIDGFTTNENLTVPFTALSVLGVTYDSLSPTQQTAINARGGPNVATVVVTRAANADGYLKVKGLELSWVQPLDKILPVRGFGFSANYTHIKQTTTGGVSGAVALGVPENTYNVTGYYEQHGYMLRLSQTFQKGSQIATANQNGITNAALFADDYKQLDLSSSIDLGTVLGKSDPYWPQITFDVINLTKSIQRQYFQFQNATFTQYDPGRTYVLGLRVKF